MARAVFRCDATASLGGGHVMRSLTLADALAARGWECIFLCNAEAPAIASALDRSPYRRLTPDEWREDADLAVIDHYGLDAAYEKKCRAWARYVAVLDDLVNRPHDCDMLVDQTFGLTADDYAAKVPAACAVLAGSGYAMLRPQFAAARDQTVAARRERAGKVKRILISMGSTDEHGSTQHILEGLKKITMPLILDIVMGPSAPHREKVAATVAAMTGKGPHQAKFHVGVQDMAALMAAADICIGAAGTTSWERCCLGLPTIMLEIADNQKMIALNLSAAGAAVNLGWFRDTTRAAIAQAVKNLMAAPDKVLDLSLKAAAVCDGKGADRVVDEILARVAA